MRPKSVATRTDSAASSLAIPSVRVGYLAPGSEPGLLLVDFAGNVGGPIAARSTVALDALALKDAVATRRPAVLLFEDHELQRPILIGMVAPEPGAALLDSLLRAPAAAPAPVRSPDSKPEAKPEAKLEAKIDGKRVVIEGEHEVVLRCGEASITLRRDGKVVLRGAYVETTAKGLNRIRGGSVKIN
jgi:hypothetical protein